jgi:hypothetical protein
VVFAINALARDVILADWKTKTPQKYGSKLFVIEVSKNRLWGGAEKFPIALAST